MSESTWSRPASSALVAASLIEWSRSDRTERAGRYARHHTAVLDHRGCGTFGPVPARAGVAELASWTVDGKQAARTAQVALTSVVAA
jgi:hypothetical protein